jgi:hypothetical protein
VEGAATREVFETYVEDVPRPSLDPVGGVCGDGQPLSSHKGPQDPEQIEDRGCCELLYLPPYSADYNPQ